MDDLFDPRSKTYQDAFIAACADAVRLASWMTIRFPPRLKRSLLPELVIVRYKGKEAP